MPDKSINNNHLSKTNLPSKNHTKGHKNIAKFTTSQNILITKGQLQTTKAWNN